MTPREKIGKAGEHMEKLDIELQKRFGSELPLEIETRLRPALELISEVWEELRN